jgi:hypothetical protein
MRAGKSDRIDDRVGRLRLTFLFHPPAPGDGASGRKHTIGRKRQIARPSAEYPGAMIAHLLERNRKTGVHRLHLLTGCTPAVGQ